MNLLLITLLISQGIATHGSSLYFDGDDYAVMPDLNLGGSLTLGWWIYTTGTTDKGECCPFSGNYTEFGTKFDSGNRLIFFWRDNGNQTQAQISNFWTSADDYQWKQVVITRDTSTHDVFFWKDTVKMTPSYTWYYPIDQTFNCLIGKTFQSMYLSGDNATYIYLYNRVLTDDEIIWNYYHPGELYDTTGLVFLLDFNNFGGDTLYDISGNGNHAVLQGGSAEPTWSIDTPIIAGGEK